MSEISLKEAKILGLKEVNQKMKDDMAQKEEIH